jgi:hypothetical protein
MSEYHTEGFVKTVSKDGRGVKFTVEAATPYLFESKEKEDGLVRRKILLVREDGSCVRICAESVTFKIDDFELTAILIAKANHMKVRLRAEESAIGKNTLVANKLEIL